MLLDNEKEIVRLQRYVKKNQPLKLTPLITYVLENYNYSSRKTAGNVIKILIKYGKLVKNENWISLG
jgi:hypothetical protein